MPNAQHFLLKIKHLNLLQSSCCHMYKDDDRSCAVSEPDDSAEEGLCCPGCALEIDQCACSDILKAFKDVNM